MNKPTHSIDLSDIEKIKKDLVERGFGKDLQKNMTKRIKKEVFESVILELKKLRIIKTD